MIIVGSMVRLRVYNDSPVHKVPVLKHVNLWHYDFPTLFVVVPIITKAVSSDPIHGEVYLIQHYVIQFVSDLQVL
jgi:hypothetical protein